jgi:hypothetical protein
MKWDEETDLDDPDEDENAEFEALRKVRPSFLAHAILVFKPLQELRNLMDSVIVVDPDLVTDAVRSLALNTIGAFQNGIAVKWNDAELGIYLVNVFGEINKGELRVLIPVINGLKLFNFSCKGSHGVLPSPSSRKGQEEVNRLLRIPTNPSWGDAVCARSVQHFLLPTPQRDAPVFRDYITLCRLFQSAQWMHHANSTSHD